MAPQSHVLPAPPAIDVPLYTVSTAPPASSLPQHFIQVSDCVTWVSIVALQ